MRLTLLSTAALLGSLAAANAADIIHHPHHSHKKTIIHQPVVIVQQPSAPAFSWAGPYLGLETGGASSHFYDVAKELSATDIKSVYGHPKDTPLAGIFAGYNIPLGQHAILGLDGNIDFHPSDKLRLSPNLPVSLYHKYKENALAAARIRLGYAQGRIMPYIAGGIEVVHASLVNGLIQEGIANPKKAEHYYKGWNLGGGLDYAVTNHMFLRADYRFAKTKISNTYVIVANNIAKTGAIIGTKSHQLRLGAAYKF